MENSRKEPLIRIEKRSERPHGQIIRLRLLSVLLAIVAGGLFILFIGYNPFSVYGTIVVIRQIKRCLFRQIKTGLSEHLTMG